MFSLLSPCSARLGGRLKWIILFGVAYFAAASLYGLMRAFWHVRLTFCWICSIISVHTLSMFTPWTVLFTVHSSLINMKWMVSTVVKLINSCFILKWMVWCMHAFAMDSNLTLLWSVCYCCWPKHSICRKLGRISSHEFWVPSFLSWCWKSS